MKQTELIKVVGTVLTDKFNGRLESKVGRGLVKLKRSQTIEDFIKNFLEDRGITHSTLIQRSECTWTTTPIMFLASSPKFVVTYVFTKFPLSEINYYGKDLSKEEIVRDFKFLKKVLT